jgi:hypothetical protein
MHASFLALQDVMIVSVNAKWCNNLVGIDAEQKEEHKND